MGAGRPGDTTGNIGEEPEMNWKNLGWGFAATMVCTHAVAADYSFNPNAEEMTRMPPYCQAKFNLKPGSREWKAWRDRIGENFVDLHHDCAGLNFVNRYRSEERRVGK